MKLASGNFVNSYKQNNKTVKYHNNMNNPKVSIIIVNYCGQKLLEKCLKSLSDTSYPNYEIIVVDNNSSDGSLEFLSKNCLEIQVMSLNKNYGFATPNNMAAKIAKGKYLVFLNNDTTVTTSWLSELVNALENDKKYFSNN